VLLPFAFALQKKGKSKGKGKENQAFKTVFQVKDPESVKVLCPWHLNVPF
jgi:hypothetical protein